MIMNPQITIGHEGNNLVRGSSITHLVNVLLYIYYLDVTSAINIVLPVNIGLCENIFII